MNKALAICFFVFTVTASAAQTHIRIFDFALGGMRYTPLDTGWKTSTSVEIAWTPLIDLNWITLRGGLGVSWPKDRAQQSFTAFQYEAAVIVPVASIFGIEANFGVRTFGDNGGTQPEVGGAMVARIGEFFDRLYIGFGRLMIPGNPVNVFRVGTGFNL